MSNSDGANAQQLTSFGENSFQTTPRWSPDGSRIAFDSTVDGQFDIWVVATDGGKPKRLTVDPANDGNPSWSNDGRWVYFDSNRSGRAEVWKVSPDGGKAIQVTRHGAMAPRESPDGKFLYYTKALSESSVWRIRVSDGEATKVVDSLKHYDDLVPVATGIYFIPGTGSSRGFSIDFLRFSDNKITTVASFEKPSGGGFTISPDRRTLLYSQTDQEGSELMLVENFR